MAHVLSFLLLTLCASCLMTDRTTSSLSPAPAVISSPGQAWIVKDQGGQHLGYLVHFQENSSATQPKGFFSVRNTFQQELGLVDDLGRSWRFEPHAKQPMWLGSGTVSEATSRIFGFPIQLSLTTLEQLVAASVPKN